jgi:hypothetical protein
MIDGDDEVVKAELQMGEQQIILGNRWKYFIFAYEIVTEIADSSPDKMGQTRRSLDPWAGEEAAEVSKRAFRRALVSPVGSKIVPPLSLGQH